MQPKDPSYKPKTTIIPAAKGATTQEGWVVVAWVIEDGQIARAICHNPNAPLECVVQRGAGE